MRIGRNANMDLLVVCADSGLSLEASFERVARELGPSYPSLTANIHLTNLEIRAGRPLKEALEHFADRLALEESRAFATLINQSIDLGSSITDAMPKSATIRSGRPRLGARFVLTGPIMSINGIARASSCRPAVNYWPKAMLSRFRPSALVPAMHCNSILKLRTR